jgi:hypothetical protein
VTDSRVIEGDELDSDINGDFEEYSERDVKARSGRVWRERTPDALVIVEDGGCRKVPGTQYSVVVSYHEHGSGSANRNFTKIARRILIAEDNTLHCHSHSHSPLYLTHGRNNRPSVFPCLQ